MLFINIRSGFWLDIRLSKVRSALFIYLAPMVVEANTLPNHETKVAMAVPAAAAAMAVAEGFNYCQETKLSRRGEPEK